MKVTKRCATCGEELPATITYFNKNKLGKHGLHSVCKTCRSAYNRRWREKNGERHAENSRRWQQENPKKNAQKAQRYRERHPEKIKEYTLLHRDERRDYYRERIKQYRVDHPEYTLHHRRLRRARKLNAKGSFTAKDVEIQYQSQRGKCWWCGIDVGDSYHVDHRFPLSRGGSNEPGNIVISCASCNLSKNNKFPHEWNGRLL